MLTGIHTFDGRALPDMFYKKRLSEIFNSDGIELKWNNSTFVLCPASQYSNIFLTRVSNENFEALQELSENRLLCVDDRISVSLKNNTSHSNILLLSKLIDFRCRGKENSSSTIKHSFLRASVIWLSHCILENTFIKADSLTLDYVNLELCKNNKLNIKQLVIRVEEFSALQPILENVFRFYVDNRLKCPIKFVDVNYQEFLVSTVENGILRVATHPEFHATHQRKKLLENLFAELNPIYKISYTNI